MHCDVSSMMCFLAIENTSMSFEIRDLTNYKTLDAESIITNKSMSWSENLNLYS